MKVLNAVTPTPEQIAALVASAEPGPVFMLNLLKFRDRAAYDGSGEPEMTGQEAYLRYADEVKKLVAAKGGGRIVFQGAARCLVIGDVEQGWDAVALVEYASPQAFVQMALSPEMNAIAHHRKAGLEGQLLIMCAESQFR